MLHREEQLGQALLAIFPETLQAIASGEMGRAQAVRPHHIESFEGKVKPALAEGFQFRQQQE